MESFTLLAYSKDYIFILSTVSDISAYMTLLTVKFRECSDESSHHWLTVGVTLCITQIGQHIKTTHYSWKVFTLLAYSRDYFSFTRIYTFFNQESQWGLPGTRQIRVDNVKYPLKNNGFSHNWLTVRFTLSTQGLLCFAFLPLLFLIVKIHVIV